MVKNPPASAGDARDKILSLGQEDPLEKRMETHSSILAWRIPWTEDPNGLQSMGMKCVSSMTYYGTVLTSYLLCFLICKILFIQ